MKRLAIAVVAAVAAGGIAAAPALAGLRGNPSFSQQIQVPAPRQAKQPSFPPSGSSTAARSEPGDDRGGLTPNPGPSGARPSVTPSAETSDDHGGGSGGGGPGPGSSGKGSVTGS